MHVFTYGSLMFDEVWSRLVAGSYTHVEATAHGYARFGVRDQTYPGAIHHSGASLEGVVYFDVDPADLARIDRFEGEDYRRVEVDLFCADGRRVLAAMYLFLPAERLDDTPWRPETFAADTFFNTYAAGFVR